MARVVIGLAAAAAAALAGCANVVDAGPAHLGMQTGSIADADMSGAQPPAVQGAVKHVSSNRVLGAMAFKKVTGAEVDPDRLVERAR